MITEEQRLEIVRMCEVFDKDAYTGAVLMNLTAYPAGDVVLWEKQLKEMGERSNWDYDKAQQLIHEDMVTAYKESFIPDSSTRIQYDNK